MERPSGAREQTKQRRYEWFVRKERRNLKHVGAKTLETLPRNGDRPTSPKLPVKFYGEYTKHLPLLQKSDGTWLARMRILPT